MYTDNALDDGQAGAVHAAAAVAIKATKRRSGAVHSSWMLGSRRPAPPSAAQRQRGKCEIKS